MNRAQALKILLGYEVNGETIGYVVSAKNPEIDIPLEEATDEQLIKAAEFILSLGRAENETLQ